MKTRRHLLSLFGLAAAAAVTLGAAQSAPSQDASPKIGEAAPAFTLKDIKGKEHSLADYKGKIVVLQWINPGCPVCKRVFVSGVEKNMLTSLKELDKDIVVLGISSTHNLDEDGIAKYLESTRIEISALMDRDGKVGRLYNAKTTPHLYVIDRDGKLRYNGAIDDDERGNKGDKATNYVVNTVKQILAGETVSPDTTRPYGCNVKYARN